AHGGPLRWLRRAAWFESCRPALRWASSCRLPGARGDPPYPRRRGQIHPVRGQPGDAARAVERVMPGQVAHADLGAASTCDDEQRAVHVRMLADLTQEGTQQADSLVLRW